MTPERWNEVRRLLERALETPAHSRDEWVAEAAGSDAELASEVRSLIAAHDEAGDFLDEPPGIDVPPPGLEGKTVGSYRLLELIDRGGMGSVFRAVRDDDAFSKEVAVKVSHVGLESELAREHFRTEREILARLEHPNIARLMDGGTTGEGLPYIVMELVSGEPITRYVRSRGLALRETVELFRTVCAAVHYAHQNLVVHRDLKPDNILVDESGTPRLLDFGIARLLHPATRVAAPTTAAFRHLTPEYASPEQLRGEVVTTGSDVYSLGVLLYELLTACHPYQCSREEPVVLLREACEVDPPPPSRAVLARADDPEALEGVARLARDLEGDLDRIVLKALEKEPARRYASAEGLGEDLRRHVVGLPVSARPHTPLYRMGKFVRRHRPAVAVGGLAAAAAIGFLVTLSVQSAQLARERDRAEAEAEKAMAVTRFLQETLAAANPVEGEGRTVTVVDALESAEQELATSFPGAPDTRAAVQETIGNTWAALGRYDKAEPLLRGSLEARRRLHGDESLEVASSLMSLGELLRQQGHLEEALEPMRRSLELRTRLQGARHPQVARALNNLSTLAWERAEYGVAEGYTRRALGILREAYGDRHVDVATALGNLAVFVEENGDPEEAERLYREVLALWRELLGDSHPHVAAVASNLGLLLRDRGALEEAEPLFRQALAIDRASFGAEHPNVGITESNLAALLRDVGEYEESSRHYSEALGILEASLGPDHWMVARGRGAWGMCLVRLGRYAEAETQLRLGHESLLSQFGPEDDRVLLVEKGLAELETARAGARP